MGALVPESRRPVQESVPREHELVRQEQELMRLEAA